MFWIKKTYRIPKIDQVCEARLAHFSEKNMFALSKDSSSDLYNLKNGDKPNPKNMFSIKIKVDTTNNETIATVSIIPNIWFLFVMGILVIMAIQCVFDEQWREPFGISFPLLIAIPYVYLIYTNKILGDLKATLIPSYFETAGGRKEVYKGYTIPLRIFLNFQRNAYILFVIIFLTAIILWMFGITDLFFPNPK